MHDPLTVAHEIKNPFVRAHRHPNKDGSIWTWRPSLVTVWHKDPEKGGSDDSCGWFSPPLTKQQLSRLKNIARDEAHDPWFQAAEAKTITDPVAAECLMRGAFLLVARVLQEPITLDEATNWAVMIVHNSTDNARSKLAYLPLYHGNTDDHDYWRTENAMSLFCIVARYILREHRSWYRHPRWHVHHWQLQIHPIQHFKRWAFSRCEVCGNRFRWGYSPVSGSWYGTGPRWFRSERGVRHSDCDRPASEGQGATVVRETAPTIAD